MFGFSLKKLLNKYYEKKQQAAKNGVQLLASILVCYSEISSLSYEPKNNELVLDFVVKGEAGKKELQDFMDYINESLQVYHELTDGYKGELTITINRQAQLIMIHLRREITAVTRGELTLLVNIMRDKFGRQLAIDTLHDADNLDEEFRDKQGAVLEQMLYEVSKRRLPGRLVGMREANNVVVYNG